jgi:hypothetical protein
VKLQYTVGPLLNQLGDFIAMAWPILNQRQN